MKILLIDDDSVFRQSIAHLLIANGHEVLAAKDGLQGMEWFGREKPALVVTDIFMPRQEGIETIRAIRRADHTVKIIAISGGGDAVNLGVLKMARLLGADAVIEKPFHAEQLLDQIEALRSGAA